jgi:O-antigen/teichoic acid export membrane protein
MRSETQSDAARAAKNTGFIVAGKVAYYGIAALANILLIRYLGSLRFGIFSVVYAYLLFFDILTWTGVDRVVVREAAKERGRAGLLLGNAFMFRLAMSGFAVLCSWLFLRLMNYPPDIRLFIYIASFGLLTRAGSLFETAYKVDLKMAVPMAIEVIVKLAHAVLIIVLIILKADLVQFFILNLLIAIPPSLLKWLYSRRIIPLRFKYESAAWRELFIESWPLALSAVFVIIFTRIDQLMIFRMLGARPVGLYSAAVRLAESMSVIPVAFMTSVFPLISRYFHVSRDNFHRAYDLSFHYLFIFIIPVAMAVTFLSKEFVLLIVGSQYVESSGALSVLVWAEVFVFMGSVFGPVLLAMHLQRLDLVITICMAGLNVFLNLLWIPWVGIAGAAWATLASYGAPLGIGLCIRRIRGVTLTAIANMYRPLLASAVMGLLIAYMAAGVSLPIVIASAVVVYLGALFVIGGLTPVDLKLFKVVLSRR